MCHSEQDLGLIPGRPDSGEFSDAYPMGAPTVAKAEARILTDIKTADQADLVARVRQLADMAGPTTPREVRELAAECVRDMQRPPGRSLDLDGIMRMYRRFRDLIAELFLPPVQAEMIRESLTISEMQGLDMEAPVCCSTCVGSDGLGIPCDFVEATEVPFCAGHGDIRERKFPAGHYCPSCGRKAR